MTPCDWCKHSTDEAALCAFERFQERVCPACYYCWKHGPPDLRLLTPIKKSRPFVVNGVDLTSADEVGAWFKQLNKTLYDRPQ